MRGFPLLLWVVSVIVGCSQAQPSVQAPAPETPLHVQASDSAAAESLMAKGGAAMRAEQWIEAERLFASAYERTAEAKRGEVAFYWGLALYRQGEVIARSNTRGHVEPARRAREYFERARTILERAEHPMRERVLQAIEAYLVPPLIEIAD